MNVTRGLPRITELVDVAKTIKMPVTTVYLADQTETAEFVERVPGLQLTSIVSSRRIEWAEPAVSMTPAHQPTLDLYRMVFSHDVEQDDGRGSGVVLVLDLNAGLMHAHGLVPSDVKRAMDRLYNGAPPRLVEVVASDSSSTAWWVRVRMLGEIVAMRARGPAEHGAQLEQHIVQRVGDYLVDRTIVSGVTGVTAASVREIRSRVVDANGGAVEQTTHVIDAAGRALASILTMPGVDVVRTTSNDVPEVHAVLGIEAAAQCLAEELSQTLGFDGRYINARHVTTVVNTMTCRGFLMQLSRHGINRVETGPLVRCSFEETIDTLFDAAAFGEYDDVVGVTPNVMLGQLCPIGTGIMDILEVQGPVKTARSAVVHSRYRPPDSVTLTPTDRRRQTVVHSRMSYQLRADDSAGIVRALTMCRDVPVSSEPPAKRQRPTAMVESSAMDLPYLQAGPELPADQTLRPLDDLVDAPEPVVPPVVDTAPGFLRGHQSITAFLRQAHIPAADGKT
jgi:DNA-directed RNA polymerase II subunit RPB1